MLQYLRIAVTVLSLMACVLLIALWVRSYYNEDRAEGYFSSVGVRFYSSRGWIVCFKNNAILAGQYTWSISLGSDYWLAPNDARLGFSLPTDIFSGAATSNISLPHWFVILIATALAASPWIKWRFSLRTLLIATTLVALALGALVLATN